MKIGFHQICTFSAVVCLGLFALACSQTNQTKPVASVTQIIPVTQVVSVTQVVQVTQVVPIQITQATSVLLTSNTVTTTSTPESSATRIYLKSTPNCERDGAFFVCFDEILELKMRLPSMWVGFNAYLVEGECGGYAYSYNFLVPFERLGASGASLDYCLPRDIASYRGFNNPKGHFTDGCKSFPVALVCQPIKENVVLAIHMPDVRSICEPGPGTIFIPEMVVAIDLPPTQKIQGFLFVKDFLSTRLRDKLFAPLGGVNIDYDQCANPTFQQQFTQGIQEISQAIQANNLDDETKYKMTQIDEFARSIMPWQP